MGTILRTLAPCRLDLTPRGKLEVRATPVQTGGEGFAAASTKPLKEASAQKNASMQPAHCVTKMPAFASFPPETEPKNCARLPDERRDAPDELRPLQDLV
jgi:hypothetical protein